MNRVYPSEGSSICAPLENIQANLLTELNPSEWLSMANLFLCVADIGMGSNDALQLTVPIEGLQDPVSLATSFAVQANENATESWTEGIKLPFSLSGSGGIEIQAGVGRLPSILANARLIMELDIE